MLTYLPERDERNAEFRALMEFFNSLVENRCIVTLRFNDTYIYVKGISGVILVSEIVQSRWILTMDNGIEITLFWEDNDCPILSLQSINKRPHAFKVERRTFGDGKQSEVDPFAEFFILVKGGRYTLNGETKNAGTY